MARGCVGNCGKKLGLVLSNLFGDVKAELRMGDPVIGGGGIRADVGGKLEGGTGAVGIIGNGGILVVEVGGVKPWFISKNFLAFFTTSSPEDSDLFLFFGVDESADDPGLEVGNFLPLSEFNVFVRFLDFFFVVEVGGVATDPGVGKTSVVWNVE